MNIQPISLMDLTVATLLILILAWCNYKTSPRVSRELLFGALRMVVQLALVALVLKLIFAQKQLLIVAGLGLVMVGIAGWEARRRLQGKVPGSFRVATLSMFVSSYVMCTFCLLAIIQADPWYHPQYAIPLLGMLLGNTLSGVTLNLSHLREGFINQRSLIENRLMLGETIWQATAVQRREAMATALIPTINSMAAAGIVSLPGMMTGQILAGADPELAVRYQILIFLLIAAGTGFGCYLATHFGSKQFFDQRERLLPSNS